MAGKWDIVCKPEGKTVYKNPDGDDDEGQNMGAMRVLLVNASSDFEDEVARVAFVRRNSKNPDTPYDEMLTKVINMARTSVDLLNTQFASSGDTL
jgi:hypothetical protein